jgi:hypothetical protein
VFQSFNILIVQLNDYITLKCKKIKIDVQGFFVFSSYLRSYNQYELEAF